MSHPHDPPDAEALRRLRELAALSLHRSVFGVAAWAAAAGLSERTLYRRLHQLTGQPPAAYLRQLRLERAHQLLLTKALPSVDEVAAAVGFDDASYFARVFHRHFGLRAYDLLSA
ncbi:helix-turn-helix transcriptional regulator [Hymenobacter sp. 15J16-1T3B]|nr:helix-turn-helix transcriptional regulator [Hymenobacter sp. 15J16-1T3B]